MKGRLLLFILLFAACVHAASLAVLRPVSEVVNDGGEVYIGNVGPGQTVSVEAEALVTSGGKFGTGGRWDILMIDEVPAGWSYDNSLLFEQPLKARIRVAPDAPDGEYVVVVRAIDDQNKEELGEVKLNLRINVTRGVFSMSVYPERLETGAAQPAAYVVTIENRGVASDAFEISAKGLPAWSYRKTAFVPYGTVKQIPYDVVSGEEGEYDVVISVRSVSSDQLAGNQKMHLTVKSSLESDYKATNNGLLLFPIFEQAAYSIMGLLSNLF